ncbi:hypothetical protein AMECASPLE_033989 [Ameca splendens]|uniref:Uncharacterized protein n=1 Tax=Ameca splendens TaxID=208324 RepID=A0ABV0ZGU5_9TELE
MYREDRVDDGWLLKANVCTETTWFPAGTVVGKYSCYTQPTFVLLWPISSCPLLNIAFCGKIFQELRLAVLLLIGRFSSIFFNYRQFFNLLQCTDFLFLRTLSQL